VENTRLAGPVTSVTVPIGIHCDCIRLATPNFIFVCVTLWEKTENLDSE